MTDELTREQYAAQIEALYESAVNDAALTVRERMTEALRTLGAAFTDAGYELQTPEPYDLSSDDYRWAITVHGNGLSEPVDVSITLAESADYDGTTDGVNFALDIVAEGGRLLGGLTPFNYTPDVWAALDDPAEIDYRLAIIEQADPASAVALVNEYAGEAMA